MHKRIFILIVIFCHAFLAKAQSPLTYLGEAFNSESITTFLGSVEYKTEEAFLPNAKTYLVSNLEDGFVFEFNSDLSLYRISLYDSGYSYNRYNKELPYKIKWGQTQAQIESTIGALEIVGENPFVKRYSTETDITDMYFTDGKLSMIRTSATTDLLKTKAKEVLSSWGVRLLPDGKILEGNCLDSIGTMMWGNKTALYKGEWSYGLPHGQGEYVDSFGNKYSGQFKLGFFWGKGDYYSKLYAYSYSGDFVMSRRQGMGKITYSNRTGYDGKWYKDEMRGYGKYVVAESYMYEGIMYNNSFNGKGKLTTPDGYINGTFKNGKPDGYCEQIAENGSQKLKGTWKNGKKEGKFELISGAETKILHFESDIEVVKTN